MPQIPNSKTSYRMINRLTPNIFRNKKMIAGSTCIAAVIGSSWYLQGNRFSWNRSKRAITNDASTEAPFIYLSTAPVVEDPDAINNSKSESFLKKYWPWKKSTKHWKCMKLYRSKHRYMRQFGVKALAALPLGDAEYLEVAQAIDVSLSVTLARTSGIDLRFFLPPPRLPSKYQSMSLDSTLRNLLSSLPSGNAKSCIEYFTSQAGVHDHDWYMESEDEMRRARRVPVKTVSQQGLRALLSHSLIPEHRSLVVSQGGLLVLHRVCQEYPTDVELQSLVAQIVGNLAIDRSLHKQIFMSGWVGVLAKWIKTQNIQLVLPADRALANMQTKNVKVTFFHEGVYILHPHNREKESDMCADVVFIHGLLGGAFKTWRQDDQQQALSKEYTHCWPKDWLARDCSNMRLLSLDYESQLSDWRASCLPGSQRHTLRSRSEEMLEKLLAAGLGERPIIWVTHSMGGLMVKLMLVEAAERQDLKENALLKQTAGIVFYGVPHKGSTLANLNASARFLLLPSAEVRELGESAQLLSLNEKFKQLASRENFKCLSFAETTSTKLALKWSTVLVSPESADPGYGEFHATESDHLSICKPSSRQSPSYAFLIDFLRRCTNGTVPPDVDTMVATI